MRRLPFAAVLVAVLVLTAPTPSLALFEGTFTASRCVAAKVVCLAKMHGCLLKCRETAARKGLAVESACLEKCRDRFAEAPAVPGRGCWAKAEAQGDCGAAVDDAATTSARIDAHVDETVRSLLPLGSVPANRCSSKKLTCVRKYDDCVLKAVRKAAVAGTALGDLSTCTRLLDGSDGSCVGKLEEKYCGSSCGSTAPPCQTFDDEGVTRLRDDAFVDEAIDNLRAGPRDVDTQRCSGDTAVRCTSAPGGVAGCGGPLGTCEFQVGAPTPQGWGAGFILPFCIQTQWSGSITGTFDSASGASAGTGAVIMRSYAGGATVAQPCPICIGDATLNDGLRDGYCSGGAHTGQPCDANQRVTFPTQGPTSLDCPPPLGTIIATTPLSFTTSNEGAAALTVGASSPNCNGAPGKKCLCATCSLDSDITCNADAECALAGAGTCTNSAGEPRRPNGCYDDTTAPGSTLCVDTGNPGDGAGGCINGPMDGRCAMETFRNCGSDLDCPAANDRCLSSLRPCYAGYEGNVGDTVTALGRHDTPRNAAGPMTLAAVFCQRATTSTLFNFLLGVPGPSRFAVAGIGHDDGGPACPTRASFVATAKGAATDIGWTGFVHGSPPLGGGPVTVAASCTGTYPDCSCTYTGPIANPNAP